MADPVIAPPAAAAPAPAAAPAAAPPAVAAAPPAPVAPRTRVVAPPRVAAPVAAAPIASAPEVAAPEAPKRAQVPARVAAELADLRAKAKASASNSAALAGYAETALATLTPELQAYIKEMVGDDPAAILRAVTGASKHKLSQAAGALPGANTAPASAPTAPLASLNDNDVKAAKHMQKLQADGKQGAATTWMAMHGAAIERGLKKLSAHN